MILSSSSFIMFSIDTQLPLRLHGPLQALPCISAADSTKCSLLFAIQPLYFLWSCPEHTIKGKHCIKTLINLPLQDTVTPILLSRSFNSSSKVVLRISTSSPVTRISFSTRTNKILYCKCSKCSLLNWQWFSPSSISILSRTEFCKTEQSSQNTFSTAFICESASYVEGGTKHAIKIVVKLPWHIFQFLNKMGQPWAEDHLNRARISIFLSIWPTCYLCNTPIHIPNNIPVFLAPNVL